MNSFDSLVILKRSHSPYPAFKGRTCCGGTFVYNLGASYNHTMLIVTHPKTSFSSANVSVVIKLYTNV